MALSNSVSRWVQVMVLSRPVPTQRAQVLDKFIQVAQVRPVLPFCSLFWTLAALPSSSTSSHPSLPGP